MSVLLRTRRPIEPVAQLVDSIGGLTLEEVAEILRLVEVGHSAQRAGLFDPGPGPGAADSGCLGDGVGCRRSQLGTSSIPASFRRLANTGPIPSMASMPWAVATGAAVRRAAPFA